MHASPTRSVSPLTDEDAFVRLPSARSVVLLSDQDLVALVDTEGALAWAMPRTHAALVRRLAESLQQLSSSELARRLAARAAHLELAVFWGRVRNAIASDVEALTLPSKAPTVGRPSEDLTVFCCIRPQGGAS